MLAKMSGFEASVRDRMAFKGSDEEMSMKNYLVLRSGIEVVREVVKTGLYVIRMSNPMLDTAISVAGASSGVIGMYLTYQKPSK